jgi:hypothetical protein
MGAFVCAYLGSLLHLPGMDNNVYLQTGVIIFHVAKILKIIQLSLLCVLLFRHR